MSLYSNELDLYDVTIATDGTDVDYVDPTEGPKTIPDITGHANAFLQVNSSETNIQWAEIGGDGDFSCDNCTFGSGSVSEPSITFKTDTNTGLSNPSADTLSISTNGQERVRVDNNNTTITNNLVVNGNISGSVGTLTGLNVSGNISGSVGTLTGLTINGNQTNNNVIPNLTSAIINPITQSLAQVYGGYYITAICNNDKNIVAFYNATPAQLSGSSTIYSTDGGLTWQATGSTLPYSTLPYGGEKLCVYAFGKYYVTPKSFGGTTSNPSNNYFTITDELLDSGWVSSNISVGNSNNLQAGVGIQSLKFLNNQLLFVFRYFSFLESVGSRSGIRFGNTGNHADLFDTTFNFNNEIVNDIIYINHINKYVVCSTTGMWLQNQTGQITTATTFNKLTGSTSGVYFYAMTYSPKLQMAIAVEAVNPWNIWYSYNGSDWNNTIIEPTGTVSPFNLYYIDNDLGFFMLTQSTGNIIISVDGIKWDLIDLSEDLRNQSVAYIPSLNRFVISGQNYDSATIQIGYRNIPKLLTATSTISNKLIVNHELQLNASTLTTGITDIRNIHNQIINCNTTSGNVDIRLVGQLYNGNVGTSFKVIKTISSSNAVRLVGSYDNVRLLTPTGQVSTFNDSSNAIDLIPATFFGSFELVRCDDLTNGTWSVFNHMVYDANGVEGKLDDLSIAGNVEANRYRAGNGTVGQPSFSFATNSGNDTGLYYQPTGDIDRLVLTVGNSGKFTIRQTVSPAERGITTHINDLDQQGNVNIGTSIDNKNLIVNGQLLLTPIIITGPATGENSIKWNNLTASAYVLDTSAGDINIELSNLQSANIGRNISFFKFSPNNSITFSAVGVNRLSGQWGTTTANNGSFANVPNGLSNYWLFDITRDILSNYSIHTKYLYSALNARNIFDIVDSKSILNSNGTKQNPAYSFTSDSDTGIYRTGTNSLGISCGNKDVADFKNGEVEIGKTGAGNSANLKVWGDLEVTGNITGTVPAPSTENLTLTGTTTIAGPINVTGGNLTVGTTETNRDLVINGRVAVFGTSTLLQAVRNTTGLIWSTGEVYTVSSSTPYHLAIDRFTGGVTEPKKLVFPNLGSGFVGFSFTFYGNRDQDDCPVQIENTSGQNMELYAANSYTTITNGTVYNLIGGNATDYGLYHAHYRVEDGNYYWVIRRYGN